MDNTPNTETPGIEVIAGRNGGELHMVTTSTAARSLVERRWAKRTEAAVEGVRDAARELSEKAGLTLPDGAKLENEYDVIRALVTAHTLNAADPSARSSVQSLTAVDRMAFPAPDRTRPAWEGPPPDSLAGEKLAPALARELLAELRARRAARASDALLDEHGQVIGQPGG